MLQSIDGARYPRAFSSVVNNRNVYDGNRPALRQFVTDCSEQAPLGAPSDANAAAAAVPPSASITSDEVVRSTNSLEPRITMTTESINA